MSLFTDARFEVLWDEYINAYNELAEYMEDAGLKTVGLIMLMEKADKIHSYYLERATQL